MLSNSPSSDWIWSNKSLISFCSCSVKSLPSVSFNISCACWTFKISPGFNNLDNNEANKSAKSFLDELSISTGKKGKDVFLPLRIALSGLDSGPELDELAGLLGKDRVLERFDQARNIWRYLILWLQKRKISLP